MTSTEQHERAVWIWFPGDYEIGLHRKVSMRRVERGSLIPPFWRLDTFYGSVKFRREYELEQPEMVKLHVEGQYNIMIDDLLVYGDQHSFILPAGRHVLVLSVVSDIVMPSILLIGNSLHSDSSWEVSCNNLEWISAASGTFSTANDKPSEYKLSTVEIHPVSTTKTELGWLYDFGKETFGYVQLQQLQGEGLGTLYYGESREEALSINHCETFDHFAIAASSMEDGYIVPASRAFRYVHLQVAYPLKVGGLSVLYEYLPLEARGAFSCSDEIVNRIWDVSVYTLQLNTREFFLDGIKRDRWVWSGDAYQSFLMNYYIFFDETVNRRTLIALRGKEPVETHINHIMDYSFYWFMGIYDHYLYTGDRTIVDQNYERMLSLMEFCLNRRNSEGMMENYPGDWVFIDWAEMEKDGEVCFEQILLCRSLEIMATCADLTGNAIHAAKFRQQYEALRSTIFAVFWDDQLGGFAHSRKDGILNRHVTKYASMFALILGFLSEAQASKVKNQVLLNEMVQQIKTPYMRFYELSALCEIDEHHHVMQEIIRYWGGMLELGATTFWEEYDPAQKDNEHYAMYGRPFGKSLCHAWGASPIYLLGKYFLGVRPTSPGYATYRIEPIRGGLEWIKGTVPLPNGHVEISMTETRIVIRADSPGIGCLRFCSSVMPTCQQGEVKELEPFHYEVIVDQQNIAFVIDYFSK